MINTKDKNLYKVFYGDKPIKIGYYEESLVHANGLLLTFDWKYIKSFTVNGETYTLPATGIVFPKKTKVVWEATPLRYCNIETTGGEFIIEDHTTIGSDGTIDILPLNIVFHHKKTTDIWFTNYVPEGIWENYEPIGIEIIPATHNVYGNGMSGVAGLTALFGCFDDNDNAWSWATERGKCGYNTSISASNSSFNGSNGDAYLPTNADSLRENYPYRAGVVDGEYYQSEANDKAITTFAPSPYNKDGSRNTLYYKNANDNCLQYFDGKSQTSQIYSRVGNKASAVKSVLEFKTLGTNEGDWYVPSTGEFGYAVSKWQHYLDIIDILKSLYLKLDLGYRTNSIATSNYWGYRSNNSSYQMTRFSVDRGYHTKSNKTEYMTVIPFCNLNNSDTKTITLDWCGVKTYTINGTVYDDRTSTTSIQLSKGTMCNWSATLLSDNYQSDTLEGSFEVAEDITLSINPTLVKTEMSVVMINKRTQEKFYTDYFFTYPKESFEPIGVVVIPKSHDVYGDGSSGVIGLKLLNLLTPDEGGTDRTGISFGGNGSHSSDSDLVYVPVYKDVNEQDEVKMYNDSGSTYAYLPVQDLPTKDIYKVCKDDDKCGYTSSSDATKLLIPSPYNPDGSRNEKYYSLEQSEYNIFGYFDGKEKTEKFLELATTQPNWKTDATILFNTDEHSYPICCASWRYHTTGTKQGDWYCPSSGETGYLCVRKFYIGYTLEAIKHFFDMDINLWIASACTVDQVTSSTNFDIGFATGRCNAQKNDSTNSINVPFTKMKLSEKGEF